MNHALNALLLAAAILSSAPLPTQSERASPDGGDTWSQAELERMSESIRLEIESLRKQAFKRAVAVELADADELVSYAKKRAAKTETPESMAAAEMGAKLLGLISPEMDLLAVEMELLEGLVGGFYDPDDDKFYLMDTFEGDLARWILAHELTHALDDQLWDIDGTLERIGDDTDAQLAYHAVVEGSGLSTQTGWLLKNMASLDMKAIMSAQDMGDLGDAPQLIWKPLYASYLLGLAFLEEGRDVDEQGFLARAFEEPPHSTEQVLHPELYWAEVERDEPRRIEIDAPAAESGWRVLDEDTLGELMLALVTTPIGERAPIDASNPLAVMAVQYTNAAATGWGGDRVILLGKDDARFLRLVTVWDTAEDAAEFELAARAVFAGLDDGAWKGEVERSVMRGTHPVTEGTAEHVVIDVRYGEAAREVELPAWREVP